MNNINLVVGTYQKKDEEAIQIISLNTETLEFSKVTSISGINSPSFVVTHGPYIFAVSEEEEGHVVSYYFDKDNNKLKELSRQPTHGKSPCYLLFDEKKMTLYTTNYMTGSVAVFPVDKSFRIKKYRQVFEHAGGSINKERQERAHAHSIETIPFAEQYKIVLDLGMDVLHLYLTEDNGKLTNIKSLETTKGGGPRHVEFNQKLELIYVLNELSSTIDVYRFDKDNCTIQLMQSVSTLPDGFRGNTTAADIHILNSGRFLLASNRGHDSIAVFKILADGNLKLSETVRAGGKTPRNFLVLSDKLVLIGLQDSNRIAVAEIQKGGHLHLLPSEYQIDAPVCIKKLK